MTAIAGLWALGARIDPVLQGEAMLAAQRIYGPDDSALSGLGDLALGRNLHRLLPEDAFDRQPIVDHERGLALVADVRLDNRDDLAPVLGLAASEAQALADAQLLFMALRRWGESVFDRIEGDYAFAFFDASAGRLILARDPFGQRPLFWHRGAGFIAFASMPAGLHALGVQRRADTTSAARFMAHLPQSGQHSYYDEINRIEPGHFTILTVGGSESRRHWTPRRSELRLKSFDDYVHAYRSELDRAVSRRLRRAKGKVSAHLSAGWDSGSVAATAARLLAGEGERLAAYTAVPQSGARAAAPRHRFADEAPLAARTAGLYGNIDHFLVPSPDRSPIELLEQHAGLFGRPLFNICNHVWLAEIRRIASSGGSKLLLTGEIGNWTISFSPNTLLAEYVRRGRWLAWAREAQAMARDGRARVRGVAATSFGPWLPRGVWQRLKHLASEPDVQSRSALHPSLRATLGREVAMREHGEINWPKDHFRQRLQVFSEMDFGEYRKGVLGGWGIDKRDATADRRLTEFCLSLPLDMLLKGGVRRPLARASLSDRLPPEVLDQPQKGYQAAEWGEALTRDLGAVRDLVEDIATDETAASVIDVELLRSLIAGWPRDGWAEPQTIGRYRIALLSALSVGHFILAANGKRGGASQSLSLQRTGTWKN